MKSTFNEAQELVRKRSINCHDQTMPLAKMWFSGLDSMTIDGENVSLLPSAQRLFTGKLRVPYSYLSRCSYGLQAHNLNYWLEQEKRQRDNLFCRFDGNSLRAVFTDRYKVVDNPEILQKMADYGIQGETEVHLNLDDNLMVIKVPDYTRAFSINADRMIPGIAVSNSEVGILAFSIEAYFYRLVCTNGLISKTEVTSKFRHVSYRALDEFNNVMGEVITQSQASKYNLAISTERQVENPLQTIASFNKQFQLTRKEAGAVDEAIALEPGNTMFHVINAYTRGAQRDGLSGEESNKLERVGGQILALTK